MQLFYALVEDSRNDKFHIFASFPDEDSAKEGLGILYKEIIYIHDITPLLKIMMDGDVARLYVLAKDNDEYWGRTHTNIIHFKLDGKIYRLCRWILRRFG